MNSISCNTAKETCNADGLTGSCSLLHETLEQLAQEVSMLEKHLIPITLALPEPPDKNGVIPSNPTSDIVSHIRGARGKVHDIGNRIIKLRQSINI